MFSEFQQIFFRHSRDTNETAMLLQVLCRCIVSLFPLIFSTLWSKITPAHEWQIEHGVSDFHVIRYNGYRFSSVQFNQLHAESLTFQKQALHHSYTTKTAVVTHHVPTFLNYPEKYKGDTLNEAFAVELFDLIEDSVADYWIYGHTHINTADFKIGHTNMLTNQLGYVKYNDHTSFVNDITIDFNGDNVD